MALPPRDHRITLQAAAAITRRHREAHVAGVKSGAFDKDQVLALLGQSGCVGLRIHFGQEEDGSPTLLLTGIDAEGTDITTTVLEEWWPCPPYCGAANPLNT